LDFEKKEVFDFGCGTGILGILAAKLGASNVYGNDITEESIINTKENCKLNQVNNFEVGFGQLELFQNQNFDIILANINRNVLLNSAATLYKMLNTGGQLILSGYMPADSEMISSKYAEEGFDVVNTSQKGTWMCLQLNKQ
jgi:ribosomal protein L11 methyltransferase